MARPLEAGAVHDSTTSPSPVAAAAAAAAAAAVRPVGAAGTLPGRVTPMVYAPVAEPSVTVTVMAVVPTPRSTW